MIFLKLYLNFIYFNTYLIAPCIQADIIEIPRPLPDTINISTNSLLLLKYWATIKVEQSLVKLTPTP